MLKKKLNLSFPPRKSIKMGNNSKLYESSLIRNAKGSERQIIGDINNNEDINVMILIILTLMMLNLIIMIKIYLI